MKKTKAILFVCLGNICRSPLAEGIFKHLVNEQDLVDHFIVESAGTSAWHQGSAPHPESIRIAQKHGVSLAGQMARQVDDSDYSDFDYLVAMDQSNLQDLLSHHLSQSAKIFCLREYDEQALGDLDVPDPYTGGRDGFELVYSMIYRSCEKLLEELRDQ